MLEKIIEYIKQKYNPLSIILYGSYANGTNNLNSDFDALVISYDHEQFHDTSFVNDIQLDVFVYPASYFDGEFDCNNFIQIIYVFLTIFLYLLKCPQSLILSALLAFCFCGKPHISRSIFLYFPYQTWLKSW